MKELIKQWLRALIEWIDGGPQLTTQQIESAKMYGNCLDSFDRTKATYQSNCNHQKGGMIRCLKASSQEIGRSLQKGDGSQYSVRKHQMMNGDWWIDCIRCGKKWRPPIRNDYPTERAFYRAVEEYERAKEFRTNNASSGSLQFRFVDTRTRRDATEQITKMYAAIGG